MHNGYKQAIKQFEYNRMKRQNYHRMVSNISKGSLNYAFVFTYNFTTCHYEDRTDICKKSISYKTNRTNFRYLTHKL